MKVWTTGTASGPAAQLYTFSRTAAILGVLVVLLSSRPRPAAGLGPEFGEPLFCGVPLARQLAIGATDPFVLSLLEGTRMSVDVVPTGNVALLKLRTTGLLPATETCQGGLLAASGAGPGMVEISECIMPMEPAPRDYTVTLSVVSQGPDNCATALPCALPLQGRFDVPGQVNSYSFQGVEGQEVSLSVTNLNPSIDQVRLRLFDPSGTSILDDKDSCPGSFHVTLPTSGEYTTLVSKCTGAGQVSYTVTWEPSTCTPSAPAGQFAYVGNADAGTVSVVDLASNTTKAIIPIAPAQATVAALTDVAITPNGGFAWATYETASAVSVINTSTNLTTASVPVGLSAGGVAISPDGAVAYVIANDLLGIAVIDTRTNQITDVIVPDIGFSEGIEVTPDGSIIFVISDDLAGLFWIDAATSMQLDFTPLNLGVFDSFAVSPDGAFVYAGTADGIVVVDIASHLAVKTIATGEPVAIAFAPDGRFAYASLDSEGTVVVIDTATQSVVGSIETGGNPGAIAVSPDSSLLYVTDFAATGDEPGMSVIDAMSRKVITTLQTFGGGPAAVALTTAPTGLCVGDAQGETKVTIDELVLSVNDALNGCPGRFPGFSVPFP